MNLMHASFKCFGLSIFELLDHQLIELGATRKTHHHEVNFYDFPLYFLDNIFNNSRLPSCLITFTSKAVLDLVFLMRITTIKIIILLHLER